MPGRDSGFGMTSEGTVRQSFQFQAEACERLGSPLTAALCRICAAELDPGNALGRRVFGWSSDPVADALPLRLTGALHGLVLAQRDPTLAAAYPPRPLDEERLRHAVAQALVTHELWMIDWLARAPQTNEVGRSAVLLPGFLAIARATGLPLWLAEIGASAGLNGLFDRYAYRYGAQTWGDADAPVRLVPEMRGAAPDLSGDLRVIGRRAADLNPIDATDPTDQLRLRSYVWADQAERRARLDGALAIAARDGVRVEQADAATWLDTVLDQRPTDAATVVYHTIFWTYLPRATQDHITEALARYGAAATADRPLAWLRFEGADGRPPALLSLTVWPAGQTRVLAEAGFHGQWLDWRAS
jgi:hypothetical protein